MLQASACPTSGVSEGPLWKQKRSNTLCYLLHCILKMLSYKSQFFSMKPEYFCFPDSHRVYY